MRKHDLKAADSFHFRKAAKLGLKTMNSKRILTLNEAAVSKANRRVHNNREGWSSKCKSNTVRAIYN